MIEIREIRMNEVVKLLNMVRETIRVSLKKEYPQSVIEKLLQDYDVDSFLKHSYNQKIFIALFNDQIIGTASILDNQIRNVFVHRNHQRKGVGKLLLKYLEEIIRDKKYSYVTVPANPFAYEFYQKLGYFIVKEEYNEFYGIVEYIIRKNFY